MSTPTARLSAQMASGAMILQPGETTTYQRNGLAERVSVYVSYGQPSNPPIPLITAYPEQTGGGYVCDKTTITALEGGFVRTTVSWVAISTPGFSYTTFESKVLQVPIEQSPQFIEIAGTPNAPLNFAIFDGNGGFIGFGPDSDFYGVVSAFTTQNLMTVRGTSALAPVVRGDLFVDSVTSTIRGAVWEWEIIYNLSINVATGIAIVTSGS